jgi:hypothetical protein
MADAQVPPEAGDAKPTTHVGLARRQALRLSDAEDVATTRLDMFGDPALKEALAKPTGHGDEAPHARTPEMHAEPPQPGDAAADSADPTGLDQPPAEAPPPAADIAEQSAEASEHATEEAAFLPVPLDQTGAEQASGREPPAPAADAADAEASPLLAAPDAAEVAPEEVRDAPEAEGAQPGPFGVPFMMPPGSPEGAGLGDMGSGPMNAPPRFRDELMFVRDMDNNPIAPDAVAPDPDVLPEAALPPPAEPAQDPTMFTDPHAGIPEDLLDTSAFPALPTEPLYPEAYDEAGTGFHESSPLPPDPVPPPPSPRLDAAAKIAAEANATAAALDNLERLLNQRMPPLRASAPPYQSDPYLDSPAPPDPHPDSLRLGMQAIEQAPPLFPGYQYHAPAPLLPLPARPRRTAWGIYVLGFLAGLALSLMAGGVLYFFIMQAGPG